MVVMADENDQSLRNEEQAGSRAGRLLSDAVLIAATPVVGYFVAYLHEIGSAQEYGIPYGFVSVDLSTALASALALVVVLIVVSVMVNALILVFPHEAPSAVRARFTGGAWAVLILVVLVSIYGPEWRAWIWAPAGAAAAFLLSLTVPLLTQRNVEGYVAKLEAADAVNREGVNRNLLSWASARFGSSVIYVTLGILLAGYLAYSTGRASAMHDRDYLVIQGKPEFVVLQVYGDVVVTAEFDRQRRCISHHLRVLKLSSKAIEGVRERVGPFHGHC
jgi:hypothetical protein